MTSDRWDHEPSDPIADIRRAMDLHEKRARENWPRERNETTRYGALIALYRRRQDSGEAKAAIKAAGLVSGNVWLADEHGPITAGSAPVIVPRWIAIGLGATFSGPQPGGEIATVQTGVELPTA